MAWTKVKRTQLDINGTTPLAVTNSPAASSGDILCAFVVSDNGAVVTGPSGWSKISTADSGAGNQKIEYWRKVAGAGEGTSYSWSTPGGSLTCITFFQLTGGDTTTPEDVTPSTVTNASTASLAATSITTATAGAMLLGAWLESGQAASLTIDATMTAESNQLATGHPNALGVGSQTLGAAGATGTRTSSWTGACPAAAMLVAVRPASGVAVIDTIGAVPGRGRPSFRSPANEIALYWQPATDTTSAPITSTGLEQTDFLLKPNPRHGPRGHVVNFAEPTGPPPVIVVEGLAFVAVRNTRTGPRGRVFNTDAQGGLTQVVVEGSLTFVALWNPRLGPRGRVFNSYTADLPNLHRVLIDIDTGALYLRLAPGGNIIKRLAP